MKQSDSFKVQKPHERNDMHELIFFKNPKKLFMKHKHFLSIFLLLTFCSAFAYAGQVVTSNADDGAGTLRQAIRDLTEGEVITFSEDMTISLSSALICRNKQVIIDGEDNEIILEAPASDHIIDAIQGTGVPDVTLRNLTFRNANNNEDGGAIKCEGDLTVEDCVFEDNVATMGGAISLSSSDTAIIKNSKFLRNGANDPQNGKGGGAIICWNSCNVTRIENCLFDSNYVTHATNEITGGAILNYEARSSGDSSKVWILNSTFVNNILDTTNTDGNTAGGAIGNCTHVNGRNPATMYIINSMFWNNYAPDGNHFKSQWAVHTEVYNSVFQGVTRTNDGGYPQGGTNVGGYTYDDDGDAGMAFEAYNALFPDERKFKVVHKWESVIDGTYDGPLGDAGSSSYYSPFVDFDNEDYRLAAEVNGSVNPLVDAGKDTLLTRSDDLAGYPRTSGDTIDYGVYEYMVSFNTDGNWVVADTDSDDNVIIDGSDVAIQSGETPACHNLYIKPDASLKIEGALTVNDLMIESDSSSTGALIDMGTLTVNGTSKVAQHLPSNRWFYLSSPVASANASVFDAEVSDNHIYHWDETAPAWTEVTDNTAGIDVMKGYAVKMPNSDTMVTFEGTLNDGAIDFTLSASDVGGNYRWNLVGNPYPSPVDWYKDAGWTKDKIYDGIYFQEDDQLCIATGGARISTPADCFNGAIAPMQGFWVFASGNNGDVLSINDNARINNSDTISLKSTIKNNIARISISGNGSNDEMVINLSNIATSGFDGSLDAYKPQMNNLTTTQKPIIYSFDNEGNALAINSLPENASVIPLGISVTTAGDYTISANNFENIDAEAIYLVDHATGNKVNLKENNYAFTSDAGEFNSRFEIQILKSVTSIASAEQSMKIYNHNDMVYIKSQNITGMAHINVIDILGRTIWEDQMELNGLNQIKLKGKGHYIINVKTNNERYIEKVIIH